MQSEANKLVCTTSTRLAQHLQALGSHVALHLMASHLVEQIVALKGRSLWNTQTGAHLERSNFRKCPRTKGEIFLSNLGEVFSPRTETNQNKKAGAF